MRTRQNRDVAGTGLVVVGVDGSPASIEALTWALRWAVERRATVEVVTAWPAAGAVWVHEVPGHFCEPQAQARQAQESAVRAATAQVPTLPTLRTRLANRSPLDALVEASREADLLVLGVNPERAAPDWTPVGDACAARAGCPVVEVPVELPVEVPEGSASA